MFSDIGHFSDFAGEFFIRESINADRYLLADLYFAEVLALRVERDAEGVTQRALMCDSDGLWLAKDRSGKLEAWEAPDLGEIIAKIGGKA